VISAKTYSLAGVTVAAAILAGAMPGHWHAAAAAERIVIAQAEPADAGAAPEPAASENAAPAAADDGQAHPAAEGSEDGAAAPAPDAEVPAVPAEGSDAAAPAPAPEDGATATPPENGTTEGAHEAPAQAEPGAAEGSETHSSSSIEASQLQIGAAVFGSDGEKIGEVNGVKADTHGKVQEVLVTAGGSAGMNAKVMAISGDKITEVKDGVKLSLTSGEAKQLPVIGGDSG